MAAAPGHSLQLTAAPPDAVANNRQSSSADQHRHTLRGRRKQSIREAAIFEARAPASSQGRPPQAPQSSSTRVACANGGERSERRSRLHYWRAPPRETQRRAAVSGRARLELPYRATCEYASNRKRKLRSQPRREKSATGRELVLAAPGTSCYD